MASVPGSWSFVLGSFLVLWSWVLRTREPDTDETLEPSTCTKNQELGTKHLHQEPSTRNLSGTALASAKCMGVYRFEDLRVWQAAKEQSDRVGKLLKRPDFIRDRALSDQMNAAALSVVFNISEGFLRRRNREMLQFLRYAFASNGEVKAAFLVAEGRGYLARAEFGGLIAGNESIARMLRRWQTALASSPNRAPDSDAAEEGTKPNGIQADSGRSRNQPDVPASSAGTVPGSPEPPVESNGNRPKAPQFAGFTNN